MYMSVQRSSIRNGHVCKTVPGRYGFDTPGRIRQVEQVSADELLLHQLGLDRHQLGLGQALDGL